MTTMQFLPAVVTVLAATILTPFMVTAQRDAQTGIEEEVLRRERDADDAMLKRDTKTLDRILADEYLEIGPGGHTRDKSKTLDVYKPGVADALKKEQVKVRMYGDVAVVNGVYLVRWKGASTFEPFRYTNVWAKNGGRWRLNTSHATLIEPKTEEHSEKK